MSKSFSSVYAKHTKALFLVGHRTGFRISELLSLTVGNVQQHGKITDAITVQRRNMKRGKAGKTSSHMVRLYPEAKASLSVWLEVLQKRLGGSLSASTPVFCSRVHRGDGELRAISHVQA